LSAILKALRKIEKESRGRIPTQSFSKRLDAGQVIHQRARKVWLLGRLQSIIIPLVVLTALIVLVMGVKPFLPAGNLLLSPFSRVHGKDERINESLAPADVLGGQTSTAEGEALRASPASSPVQDRPPAPRRNLEAGTAQKTSTKTPLPAAASSPSEPHPALELQAIVWSDDPAACFAVINGRIVRSGGMVSGVSLVEISREAVSLKLGGKTWTMRMLEGD
jgi:hypothetical protein